MCDSKAKGFFVEFKCDSFVNTFVKEQEKKIKSNINAANFSCGGVYGVNKDSSVIQQSRGLKCGPQQPWDQVCPPQVSRSSVPERIVSCHIQDS